MLSIVFIWGLLPLGAQQEQATDIEDISFEELLNIEVTVASKSQQSIGDAPSSVTVFTREEIKNMGIGTVEELLNYVPGFITYRNVDQFKKDIVSPRGGRFTDVLFQYNGQRINNLYSGAYSDGNQFIPVDNIKQVEIIRGPGSALYGSNAFLGVVNIVAADNLNNFSVTTGNGDRKEVAVNFSKKVDELTVSAFVQAFSDNGLEYTLTDRLHQTAKTRDPENGFNALLTLKYKNWVLNARHNEAHIEDFIMYGCLANGMNDGTVRQSFLNLNYHIEPFKKMAIDVSAGYLDDTWRVVFMQLPIGAIPVALNEQNIPTKFNQQVLGGGPNMACYIANLNIDSSYEVSMANQLIAGISIMNGKMTGVANMGFWNFEVGNSFEYYPVMKEDIKGKEFTELKTRNVFSVYLQDDQKLGKALKLTAGIRLDNYSDFGSSLNPRLALIYTTPFKSTIKFMYGHAFRAPNFRELYNKNNTTNAGNPNLGAEKVTTIEAAYVQEFKNFQGVVTLFQSKMSELIVLGKPLNPDDPSSPHLFENLGEQTTRGLELELRTMAFKNLIFYGSLLHFIDKKNIPIPQTTGSFAANYRHRHFNFNINGLYRGKWALSGNQKAYLILNTKLTYHLSKNLNLMGVVHNLMDTTYYTYSSSLKNGIQNRGRTFTVGLEWGDK